MICVSGLVNNLFPKRNIIPTIIYIQYRGGVAASAEFIHV